MAIKARIFLIVDTFVYDYTIDHGIFHKAFDF